MTWRPHEALARAAGTCGRIGLVVRRGMGERLGERRFPGRPQPSGTEIEAFRPYAPGDDLRHLDWNAVGRLDALVTRRFTAEREVRFDLLVDASASMGLPARDGKLDCARELAMALVWMALASGDAVRLATLGGAAPLTLRHRSSAVRAAAWLATLAAGGALDLADALVAHARRHPGPAVTLLVSDLMAEPDGLDAGLQALRAARHTVVLLHVLGPGEIDPSRDVTGGVLCDVESGATHPIALTPALRARYDAVLAEHLAALEATAARRDVAYARFTSDEAIAAVLVGRLAPLGLVRRR